MKRALVFLAAIFLGLTSAEWLSGNFAFRRSLGRLVRHDELVALVGRRGIYAQDLVRRPDLPNESQGRLQQLIEEVKLANASAREAIASATIERQMNLLRWQFPNEAAWNRELENAGETASSLRRELAATLRGEAWLEARIAIKIVPNDDEVSEYFARHADSFCIPERFRASHLFLAAPVSYPDEVIKRKRAMIDELASQLGATPANESEEFAAFGGQNSEDEATKNLGGDLNYFAEERMPPEIFAAAQELPIGLTSAPIRSRLGFHLLRVTEHLPTANLALAEVWQEIVVRLENSRRAVVGADLISHLHDNVQLAPNEQAQ